MLNSAQQAVITAALDNHLTRLGQDFLEGRPVDPALMVQAEYAFELAARIGGE